MPVPADGNGLNPLLSHLGMAFHPPLIFLGHAGFGLPGCAALAHAVTNTPGRWTRSIHNLPLLPWAFQLGPFWELGGSNDYWAWDPVENASLIPWLTGTAFLHIAVIEQRTGALKRSNVALIAGTYISRTAVVQSLHALR